jgi:hypothetical protein
MYSLFWQDAWKILLYSLVLGAGLPVIYALGVRSLAIGTARDGSSSAQTEADTEPVGRSPIGTVLATICFVIVVAGVAVGLAYIIASGKGEQLSFSHVYPTFVPKS